MPVEMSYSNVCDKNGGTGAEVVMNYSSVLIFTEGVITIMYSYISHYFSSFWRNEMGVVQCPLGVCCTTNYSLTLSFSI